MSDSVKKYYEILEDGGFPAVPVSKRELHEAFLFNLECYDRQIIDREDFINAMEDYMYG